MPKPRNSISLGALAERIGGRVVGDGAVSVSGIAPIDSAEPGQLTFLSNPRYRDALATCRATAVIIAEAVPELAMAQLVLSNPYYGYAQAMQHFYHVPHRPTGISPDARVAGTVGADPDIGAFVSVGEGTRIGDRVTLHPGAVVGKHCELGDDVTLHPGVVVRDHCTLGHRVIVHANSVVGSDGFGYATHQGVHHKIPHVGRVVLEDDVEVGANVAIDRGVLGDTVIGAGSKLDNLVQIAHNVRTGRGCLLAGQMGISGSTRVGNYFVAGGQSGVAGHLSVGDQVILAAKGGITKDIADSGTYSGFPAMPHREALKAQAAQGRIGKLNQRIKTLEARLNAASDDRAD